MKQQESMIIQRLQQGERSALREVFDQYYPYLIGTGLKISGNKELARDVAQEVFLEIWKKREQLYISSSLKAYLRRAMVNRMLNQLNSKFAKHEFTGEIPEKMSFAPTADAQMEGIELQERIQTLVDELPERCRLVFVLCKFEGLSHKEIATKLDLSPKTIENQITKALKILREGLKPYLSQKALSYWFSICYIELLL